MNCRGPWQLGFPVVGAGLVPARVVFLSSSGTCIVSSLKFHLYQVLQGPVARL